MSGGSQSNPSQLRPEVVELALPFCVEPVRINTDELCALCVYAVSFCAVAPVLAEVGRDARCCSF